MDSPFFSTYWNQPSQARYSPSVVGGIPVQRKSATATKVVSIPVHFVGSDMTRSKSALKIQKVFRGFLVRKCVKKIASIRKEVDEMEQRIFKKETVELIRREPKERLRINEILMASLFKLDSVRGIDFGVRNLRKAVIKKAIALQEKVDAVVANNDSDMAISEADQVPEITDSVMYSMNFDDGADRKVESQGELVDHIINNSRGELADRKVESRGELVDHIINDSALYSVENSVDCKTSSDQTIETEDLEKWGKAEGTKNVGAEPRALMETNEVGVGIDDGDPHCDVKEIVGNCISTPGMFLECSEEGAESSPLTENWSMNNTHQSLTKGGGGFDLENSGEKVHQDEQKQHQQIEEEKSAAGECKGNKAIVERMKEDNEKMMRMMSDLMERNEMQTRMLTSLNQRVGQLEKAFFCDKLRKTKKKRQTL